MQVLILLAIALGCAFAAPSYNQKSFNFCKECEAVIASLENHVASESQIQQELDSLCKQLPAEWEDYVCEAGVAAAAPAIYKALQQALNHDINPSKVCSMIPGQDCSSMVKTQVGMQKAGFQCQVCESIINYLDQDLLSEAVEKQLQGYFSEACNQVIPAGQDQQVCDQIINQYFPEIWAKIVGFLNGQEICTDMKMCSAAEEFFVHSNAATNPAALGCSFCKNVFTWFQAQILNPATEKQILAEVEKVCADIPNTDYAQKCRATLDEYGDKLFKKVTEILGPANVCEALHACPSS